MGELSNAEGREKMSRKTTPAHDTLVIFLDNAHELSKAHCTMPAMLHPPTVFVANAHRGSVTWLGVCRLDHHALQPALDAMACATEDYSQS